MDKMIKKVNVFLVTLMIITFVACAAHVLAEYVILLKANADMATSFPPYAAVLYAIPYSLVLFVLGVISVTLNLVNKFCREKLNDDGRKDL